MSYVLSLAGFNRADDIEKIRALALAHYYSWIDYARVAEREIRLWSSSTAAGIPADFSVAMSQLDPMLTEIDTSFRDLCGSLDTLQPSASAMSEFDTRDPGDRINELCDE